MDRGRREDVSALAAHVQAGEVGAHLKVPDFDAVLRPFPVQVSAAAAGDDFDRLGQRRMFGFEAAHGRQAFVAVLVRHPNAGVSAGGDADVVLTLFAPKAADDDRVDRREPEVVFDGWLFASPLAGEDSQSALAELDGGLCQWCHALPPE
ncbi:MAG TPA: hypothetical protein VGG77_10230 [Roseiarcus sp.]|jgi:hypothetical protein